MSHPKTDGCCCRACMGKNPAPEETMSEDYPPNGDYRWVRIGDHWEQSRVTKAGTLIIPKPDYYSTDTTKFVKLLDTVAIAHGLDAKKVTGIRSWEDIVAIHFN